VSSMIDKVLQEAVDASAVPSVAAIAADRSGVIYEGGAGSTVAGRRDPIGADTHFRIMSMTKLLTTVAALQQKEMGNLAFDARRGGVHHGGRSLPGDPGVAPPVADPHLQLPLAWRHVGAGRQLNRLTQPPQAADQYRLQLAGMAEGGLPQQGSIVEGAYTLSHGQPDAISTMPVLFSQKRCSFAANASRRSVQTALMNHLRRPSLSQS
jgi:hypothetical protein